MMKRLFANIGVCAFCLLQTLDLLAQSPATAASKPIAIQPHEVPGVEVALLEVKRTSGNTVTVRWHVRNKSSRTVSFHTGGMDGYRLSGEAYLLDAVNRVKYVVMKDSDDQPVAALQPQFGTGVVLAAGQTAVTWAKFQAPAAGVTKLTVNVPGAPPFEDVPLN